MNNTIQNSNIPQLRFPEFEGEWVEKKLGNIGEYIGGGTPDTSVKEYWHGAIPWVSSSDICDDSIHKIDKTRFITKKAIEESATKLVPKGSILMVSRVGIGKFAIADEELCTSQDFTNLITNENEYFLGYYFKTKSNRFVSLSQGTSIKGFTTKDIKSAKFYIPTLPEQTRIATFITAVDKRITLLQKKKAELEQYKKGVMQKIFNGKWKVENGKRKFVPPTIRFKPSDEELNHIKMDNEASIIFNSQFSTYHYKDWEEKKLGEVCDFLRGSSLSKNDILENGINKCIHYGELFTIYDEKISNIISRTNIDGIKSRIGDILMPSSDVTPTGLATASAVFEDNVILGGDINVLRPIIIVDALFISYLLNYSKSKIIKLVTGTTVKHIYNKDVKQLKFTIPKSVPEQQKIAKFLSSIDKSIEKTGQQIEASQEWKQGLLQKMFV